MEEHCDGAKFAARLECEQEGAVGDVECAVRSHGQVQGPREAVCERGLRLAAAEDLGDLAGEARDEQAVADEGEIVETRSDIGQHGAVAGARVDSEYLSGAHLRGDDVALGVELQCDRNTEIAGDAFGFAAVRIDTPDVVGAERWVVQLAVRADLEGVGQLETLDEHLRCAAVEVDFHQASVGAALVDEEPALMEGDAVDAGEVVAQQARASVVGADADSSVVVLGDVELPVGVEGQVVGGDDVATLGLMVSTAPLSGSNALIWLPATCAT